MMILAILSCQLSSYRLEQLVIVLVLRRLFTFIIINLWFRLMVFIGQFWIIILKVIFALFFNRITTIFVITWLQIAVHFLIIIVLYRFHNIVYVFDIIQIVLFAGQLKLGFYNGRFDFLNVVFWLLGCFLVKFWIILVQVMIFSSLLVDIINFSRTQHIIIRQMAIN